MIHSIDSSGIIHIFKGKQTEPIKLVVGEILTAEIMDIFPTGNVQVKINNRIINAQPQREMPLARGDTILVKVEKPLEDGTIPLRILSSSEVEKLNRPLMEIERNVSEKILKLIESIFTQKAPGERELKAPQAELIKNLLSLPLESLSEAEKTALMKKLIDIFSSNPSTSKNIQELINLLEVKNFSKDNIVQLKNLIIDNHEDLNPEKLKQTLLNTGISFEAKIKQTIETFVKIENLREDLKVILHNIARQANEKGLEGISEKVHQILRQIEGYQILSKTYDSFFTFLPFHWKELEGGNLAYKTFKRSDKEYHTVFINLNFKDEPLSFVVTMINKNLFVSFSGQSNILDLISENEEELKDRFQKAGLFLSGINYVSKSEELLRQWNIKEGIINLSV